MADIARLLQLMEKLRDPQDGCPWDVEQSFETIAPYTIEEAYEVEDAIQRRDWAALPDELGDLLLQVVFHAQMARERGWFGFDDVVDAICDKLVRRHPNVFAGERLPDAAAQFARWEELKAAERAERAERDGHQLSALDGVAVGLPALTRAAKLVRRARRAGFRWSAVDASLDKLDEEVAELRAAAAGGDARDVQAELGDVLLAAVGAAADLGADPEAALRAAVRRFEARLRHVERALDAEGRALADAAPARQLELWEQAKRLES